jgi:hypothetical protein
MLDYYGESGRLPSKKIRIREQKPYAFSKIACIKKGHILYCKGTDAEYVMINKEIGMFTTVK